MSNRNTRDKILEVAKEEFDDKGIGAVTMNLLAEKTGYVRRTIYRYFDSKEDVAYHVMLSYMETWNEAQRQLYDELLGNGLEKLEQQLLKLLDYMEQEMHMIRFLADFDNYFRDNLQYEPAQQIDEEALQSYHLSDRLFYQMIDEGIADGSIHLEEDKGLFLATMTQFLWVFGQTIALRGRHLKKDTGFDGTEMFRCQVRLYIDALRSKS